MNSTIVYKGWLSCGIFLTDSDMGFFERLISKFPFSISTESDSLLVKLNTHTMKMDRSVPNGTKKITL